jgi:hypothetical protein
MAAAFYFSLLQQVTVGSNLTLPVPFSAYSAAWSVSPGFSRSPALERRCRANRQGGVSGQLHPHQAN